MIDKLKRRKNIILICIIINAIGNFLMLNNNMVFINTMIKNYGSYKASYVLLFSIVSVIITVLHYSFILYLIVKFIGKAKIKFWDLIMIYCVALTGPLFSGVVFFFLPNLIIFLIGYGLYSLIIYFMLPKYLISVERPVLLRRVVVVYLIVNMMLMSTGT